MVEMGLNQVQEQIPVFDFCVDTGLEMIFHLFGSLIGKAVLAGIVSAQGIENFNKSLQGSKVTVSGMLEAAEVTIKNLQSLRCEHKFKRLFEEAEQKLHLCDLDAIPLSRKKKIPKRLDQGLGFASNYCHDSAEEFYRVEFFSVIDAAVLNIKEYFTSTDLTEYQDLSSVLLTGTHKPEIITKYLELNESLNQQLDFFHNQFKESTVEDYRKIFADMVPEVRRMFPQIEALLRLLLVSPASSCTAERSFSALRRLKTWLRSSMSQQRLNHLMICHVHRDRLATLSPQAIAEEFIRAELQKTNEGPFFVDSN
ncbi:zinc finger MYM-type protein 1-like [Palaemon carinicauda]|uniref:zinc finger MYM-type protein 1-like n=1 Tax=Palaemon carinicauda TaxID=392227 RepID=UPI0035B67862